MSERSRPGKQPGKCRHCGDETEVYRSNGWCTPCWSVRTSENRRKRLAEGPKGPPFTHCSKCGGELDAPYPRGRWCRACMREKYRGYSADPEWRARMSEKRKAKWAAKTAEEKRVAADKRRAWKFGLSLDEYRDLLTRPCAICGRTEFVGKNDQCIDHCHETGKVRDVLCRNCNSAIGLLADDPDLIRRAAEYVAHHKRV